MIPVGTVSEWVYEEYIDRAYGRGEDLRNTVLWKDSYERGFVCPDEEGGWLAFAYDGRDHFFLGRFGNEIFPPEEEDIYDREERILGEADRASPEKAIAILRDLYLDPDFRDETTPEGIAIANDPECVKWISDYWAYICWNEHGNQCLPSEVRFGGFVEDILDPSNALEYLMPDGEDYSVPKAVSLAGTLKKLHRRYAR